MKPLRPVTFLLCILAACQQKPQPNTLPAPDEAIPVVLAAIGTSTGRDTIETSGLLSTEDESKLSFKIGGVIDAVFVKEGSLVRKGQVLATLEIAAQVNQVELSLQKAERDYQRAVNLYNDSVVTLEQLQNAKTGLEIARQNLSATRFNQQYARIYAPADGFVVKQLLHAGEIASPGNPVLVLNHTSGRSSWVLRCGLTDVEWASVSEGARALVTLDAFTGKSFEASVTKKALAANPQSGVFEVELRLRFSGERPAVGMFGKAFITANGERQGQLIPYAALLEANGNAGYVFVTSDKKTVKRIPVILGKMHRDRVEVLSGLEGHTQVVVAGSAYLSEQSRIAVKQ
jgi:RND family efflux transporter MFP subunit